MRDEAAYLLRGRAVDEARSIYEALLDDQDDWASYEGFVMCSQTLKRRTTRYGSSTLLADQRPKHRGPRLASLLLVDGDALKDRILSIY